MSTAIKNEKEIYFKRKIQKRRRRRRRKQKEKGNPVICTAWMDLEDVMLGEINQSQKGKYGMSPLM